MYIDEDKHSPTIQGTLGCLKKEVHRVFALECCGRKNTRRFQDDGSLDSESSLAFL